MYSFTFTPLNIVFLLIIFFLLCLSFIFYKKLIKNKMLVSIITQDLDKTKENLLQKENDVAKLTNDNQNLILELTSQKRDNYNLTNQLNEYATNLASSKASIDNLSLERTNLKNEIASLNERIRNVNEQRKIENDKQEHIYKDLEQKLTIIGEKLLKERSAELQKSGQEQFSLAVKPLKEELSVFREFLNSVQKISSEQAGSLKNELLKLQQAQQSLTKQADELSFALRSNGKSQGIWGEHQLELVLENSGLRKGYEYDREVAGNRSLGENGRPDVVIRLPKGHSIIIDSKCSLTDYTVFINAAKEEERNEALKKHLSSLKSHINELAKAKYNEYLSLNSPSFVFMFVPIDNALSLALKEDSNLYDYAVKNNVYLVSPSNLLPALRVVSNLWVLSTQNDRLRKLASDAQNIYKKCDLVIEAFEDMEKRYKSLGDSIDNAGNRFYRGKGNLRNLLQGFSFNSPKALNEADGAIIEKEPIKKALISK